jgi:hypothetical protein
MTFATKAEYVKYDPTASLIGLRDSFNFSGGGTNFQDIFIKASKKYDRVIILSDMQGWMCYDTPKKQFGDYKKKYNCDPFVYSWDLQGLGTLQLPENKVFALAGFSEKVFDIMKFMEEDKQALYNRINEIEL